MKKALFFSWWLASPMVGFADGWHFVQMVALHAWLGQLKNRRVW